jgi:UDP-N-acetylglucosamine--N-acetylmuramyl-(pentapeptide) pyrophosphoryl-undecaprenol N-acetylglucosamine transferase
VRVVLTGGGTGGHIYPALSVAQCLTEDEVLYVGAADGPEATLVPRAGVEFRSIPSRKVTRRLSLAGLGALGLNAAGVLRGAALLRSWKPQVVLGTGGYASTGVMFAAAMLRIPTVVHESNAVPGRVNRLLGRLCTRVALVYEAAARYFPAGKVVMTGQPVRLDLLAGNPEAARAHFGLDAVRPVLVVTGGSGGARTLNAAVPPALPELRELGIQVVHATGKAQWDAFAAELPDPLPEGYHPAPYVDDMPSLLAAAALIVCRGGSSTLAEVNALGLPAIVTPFPYAVGDHQTHNARALAAAGAAVLLPDAELTGARLAAEVRAILGDPARLAAMREASLRQGKPDAARRVADLLRTVVPRI